MIECGPQHTLPASGVISHLTFPLPNLLLWDVEQETFIGFISPRQGHRPDVPQAVVHALKTM